MHGVPGGASIVLQQQLVSQLCRLCRSNRAQLSLGRLHASAHLVTHSVADGRTDCLTQRRANKLADRCSH